MFGVTDVFASPKMVLLAISALADKREGAKLNYFAVNIGAADIPITEARTQQDAINQLFSDGWGGLAIEPDITSFRKLELAYPQANIQKENVFLTPHNVASVIRKARLRAENSTSRHTCAHRSDPSTFDILKIDIDSIDCPVLLAVVESGFRPKLVLIEVNAEVPPPIRFSLLYEPDASVRGHWDMLEDRYTGRDDAFFGCSLSMASGIMTKYGYTLLQLDGWDATYIHNDFASLFEAAIHRDEGREDGLEQAQERILFHLSGLSEGARLISSLPDHSPCLFKYNIVAQAGADRFAAGSQLFRYMLAAGGGAPFMLDY
jgi:hypothetical protein